MFPEIEGIVSGHDKYFRNHRRRIRYATSLRHGYPIGSGPTEGACKSPSFKPGTKKNIGEID